MTMATIGQAAGLQDPPRARMSVAEYEGLIESGVIDEKAPVELVEGRIVGKMTKGTRHCVASDLVQGALLAALGPGSGWIVRREAPVAIPGRDSEPEPDVSIVRGRPEDYLDAQPRPDRVGLIVEVSDSSLAADRALAETYIGGGIPAYWLLNLPGRSLEVHTAAGRQVIAEGDLVELVLDGSAVGRIAVADMLPRRPAAARD